MVEKIEKIYGFVKSSPISPKNAERIPSLMAEVTNYANAKGPSCFRMWGESGSSLGKFARMFSGLKASDYVAKLIVHLKRNEGQTAFNWSVTDFVDAVMNSEDALFVNKVKKSLATESSNWSDKTLKDWITEIARR